jgi:hypothetical protein
MQRNLPSYFRFIAFFLVMTIVNSGMAMASYVCPQLATATATVQMMEGMPCAGMDVEKPVHCAEFTAGAKASLEHLNAVPALAPPSFATLFRVLLLSPPPLASVSWTRDATEPTDDPPYRRTLRIRI